MEATEAAPRAVFDRPKHARHGWERDLSWTREGEQLISRRPLAIFCLSLIHIRVDIPAINRAVTRQNPTFLPDFTFFRIKTPFIQYQYLAMTGPGFGRGITLRPAAASTGLIALHGTVTNLTTDAGRMMDAHPWPATVRGTVVLFSILVRSTTATWLAPPFAITAKASFAPLGL